jgi:nucleotide-binding universal stress UspA family protein
VQAVRATSPGAQNLRESRTGAAGAGAHRPQKSRAFREMGDLLGPGTEVAMYAAETERTERIAMANNTPYTIIVGYDFSDIAELALARAVRMARRNGPAALHVVTALDAGIGNRVTYEDAEKTREGVVAKVAAMVESEQPNAFTLFVHARIGAPSDEILALAAEAKADVIVVGTHGRTGVQRLLLGSVAEKVLRHAPCPVMVVRPKRYEEEAEAPSLEPACPRCVARREETDGEAWWCDEHAKPYVKPHRYDYRRQMEPSSSGKSTFY